MPDTEEPSREALSRLDARLAAFEADRQPASGGQDQRAIGRGYRFLGEVVGGVLGGLGFGWLLDQFAHTAPFGLIGGLLIGVVVSSFVAVRGAGAWAKAESAKAGKLPNAADDEED
jgi:ATP synthase protein I